MIPKSQKLNPNIFDSTVPMVPIRKGFGEGLLLAGKADKNVVGLCADLTESTQMHLFKAEFPERFVEIGVAEQNLATVASGMAAMGKIPFISSYAMFSPGRNWEQIRTTISYNDRKVIVVGSHAGVSVGPDGGTHQAIEDIALMRVIPNMIVVVPCDAIEAKKATLALANVANEKTSEKITKEIKSPAYLRLGREKTAIVTSEDSPFEIGKAQILYEPVTGKPDVTIIATGVLVHKALLAAKELEKEKIGVQVINMATIKPLDIDAITRAAKASGAIVTAEEHQIIGGLGGAVAEALGEFAPVPLERIGVDDEFGQSGTPEELLEHYNMGTEAIKKAVLKVIKRK